MLNVIKKNKSLISILYHLFSIVYLTIVFYIAIALLFRPFSEYISKKIEFIYGLF